MTGRPLADDRPAPDSPGRGGRVSADQPRASWSGPVGAVLGDTLDGRFRLTAVISRGGMATIFRAEDLAHPPQVVAVKVPHPMYASGLGAWSMFQREEEIGRKLDHPAILKFVPVNTNKRRSYVVTEYLCGETLADHFAAARPLAEADALTIASRIAAALQYLHDQGVVHYDLKPGNVMLCDDGSIRIIDFGLAQPRATRRFNFSGGPPVIGTAAYIAPEQIKRQRGRPSADIYSLGTILYEMLTGQPPFPGDDPFLIRNTRLTGDPVAPRRLNPKISPPAEEIVLRALRRNPAERYPTAAALKADLDAPDQVRVTGLCHRLQPSTRWKRGLRLARYIAITCVLPLAAQVLLFFLLWHHLAKKH